MIADNGPAVTLAVVEGSGAGAEFVFDQKAHCVVGRAEDCNPRIDEDVPHKLVSRHHCLFDINPPSVRVRDFGSLNGTYVNGIEIGRRRPGQTPEEGARATFRERDLIDGDEVKLGRTVIRIGVNSGSVAGTRRLDTPRCAQCGADLPGGPAGKQACGACRRDPARVAPGILRGATASWAGPQAIGPYEVVHELGRGGQGVVYLVREVGTDLLYALKLLPAQVAVDPRAERSFLREIDSVQRLDHPNLVRFRDSGVSGAVFYFVCEYCRHGSLSDLVKRGGPLDVEQAVAIAAQALDGLHHAHTMPIEDSLDPTRAVGLVHRDVKPANILLTGPREAPVAKLADFGLAKAFDHAGLSGHTLTGSVMGTVAYMSRPQLINYKYAQPAVDVWAMAATVYYLVTGCSPREFHEDADPIAVILSTGAVPVRDRVPALPRRFAAILDEALIDKPAIRFTSAAQLREALLGVV